MSQGGKEGKERGRTSLNGEGAGEIDGGGQVEALGGWRSRRYGEGGGDEDGLLLAVDRLRVEGGIGQGTRNLGQVDEGGRAGANRQELEVDEDGAGGAGHLDRL